MTQLTGSSSVNESINLQSLNLFKALRLDYYYYSIHIYTYI